MGMDLPPRAVVEILVCSFLKSTLWFLSILHEPTLWTRLNSILHEETVTDDQVPFLMVVLMILVHGARYIEVEDVIPHVSVESMVPLLEQIMQKVEERLLLAFDRYTTDNVTFLFLLSSHYLYNRRPARAFVMFGATVKAAQAMGLHDENLWGKVDHIEREIRRRLWWTLYISDG
jgi:hypothetical protein